MCHARFREAGEGWRAGAARAAEADPLADIEALTKMAFVMKDGQVFKAPRR